MLVSPNSTRELYAPGQHTIPSDTACYPAKLLHGHMEWLLAQNPDAIFYPDMSYNVEEHLGDDHFNCPVVAYYPQVLKLNVPGLQHTRFISDFVGLHDRKQFQTRIREILAQYFAPFSKKQIAQATGAAYAEYAAYHRAVQQKAQDYLAEAKRENQPVVVLCGRPYHVDPEVSHGIDKLLCDLGAAVITEDSLSPYISKFPATVRNQWTYHARMYAAAKYVAKSPDDLHVVQLVSFGCGVDAVTTDEVRGILESAGKDYTQLKIDEITNMGAASIRLRSLFAMLDEKRKPQ